MSNNRLVNPLNSLFIIFIVCTIFTTTILCIRG